MSDERPNKQEIIRRLQIEARRLGKTPSMKEFFENPNVDVSKGDVFYHWPRWNDAVKEACLDPNEQTRKRPLSDIASHYLEAVRHHDKVPTRNELRIYIRERKDDGTAYSGQRAFENLGMSTIEMVRSALGHATSSNKWDDVILILEKYLSKNAGGAEILDTTDLDFGFVYLVAEHSENRHYKIGCARNPEERLQNLQTGSRNSLQLVHRIKTDDMHGVERYWHTRFEGRHQRGEWYGLSSEDVNAFKRWRKIF